MKFSCPHCDQHLQADEEMAGASLNCPNCGASITCPQTAPAEAPSEAAKKGPPPLPVQASSMGLKPRKEALESPSGLDSAMADQVHESAGRIFRVTHQGGALVLQVDGGAPVRPLPLNRFQTALIQQGDSVMKYLLRLLIYTLVVVCTAGFALLFIFFLGLDYRRKHPEVTFMAEPGNPGELPEMVVVPFEANEALNAFGRFLETSTRLEVIR